MSWLINNSIIFDWNINKQKNPRKYLFYVEEDCKEITVETSGSQLWQWCNTSFIIPDGAFMFSVQKIAAIPYVSNIECMNIKGWYEVIAFSVDSSCCIITLISSWIYKNAFYTKIPPRLCYTFSYLFQHHIVLKCLHRKGHSFSFQNISLWFLFPEVHTESTIDKRTSHNTLTYLWGISFRSTHFIRERLLQPIIFLLMTFSNH